METIQNDIYSHEFCSKVVFWSVILYFKIDGDGANLIFIKIRM